MKKKLTYDDIKLNGKVKSPSGKAIGEIVSISNEASVAGIDEPIFKIKFPNNINALEDGYSIHFGLKYILKYYIQD